MTLSHFRFLSNLRTPVEEERPRNKVRFIERTLSREEVVSLQNGDNIGGQRSQKYVENVIVSILKTPKTSTNENSNIFRPFHRVEINATVKISETFRYISDEQVTTASLSEVENSTSSFSIVSLGSTCQTVGLVFSHLVSRI